MKLITEYIPGAAHSLYEADEKSGQKKLYIEGIFMESAKVNRNKRIYPTPILESAVNLYIDEEVKTGGAIGELNHPASPIPNPKEMSHKIIQLEKRDTDFWGKAVVLNTPNGNIVRAALDEDVRLGVSSRGLGGVKDVNGINEVQKGYVLKCVDVVHNPSAINAFVNGIMEGVEYLVDGSTIDQNDVDRIEQSIKKAPPGKLMEAKIAAFRFAMSRLVK
jgi:hypothetical protein